MDQYNKSSRSRSPIRNNEDISRSRRRERDEDISRSRRRERDDSRSRIDQSKYKTDKESGRSKLRSPAPNRRRKTVSPASRKEVKQVIPDLCKSHIFNMCKDVQFTDPKWFEKRNACIYMYLKENIIDTKIPLIENKLGDIIKEINKKLTEDNVKEKDLYSIHDKDILYKIINDTYPIFDQVLAISILLSFLDESIKKEADILNIKFSSKSYNEFLIKFPDGKNFTEELEENMGNIIKCNKIWNKNDEENFYQVRNKLNLRLCLENPAYNNLKIELSFLEDIMGVINRSDYVLRGDKYYDEEKNKIYNIKKEKDDECDQLPPKLNRPFSKRSSMTSIMDEYLSQREESPEVKMDQYFSCEDNSSCKFRKGKCINKERHATARPNKSIPSYYLLKNLYKNFGSGNPNYYLYIPLNYSHTVAGFSGVFERKYIDKNGNALSSNPKQISIVFPPFDMTGEGGVMDIAKIALSGLYNFGFARSMRILDNGIGVLNGLYEVIEDWYTKYFSPLNIPMDSEIFISGTSLGGALTNLCAFHLRIKGFDNIHYYANGAPRVGNSKFKEYMEMDGNFSQDSGNFIRYINIIKTDDQENTQFITEFDPVCKFPPKDSAYPYKVQVTSVLPQSLNPYYGYDYLISDNPRLTVVESAFLFDPYVIGYGEQSDYEMLGRAFSRNLEENINLGRTKCSNHFDYIHSIPAYSHSVFNGDEVNKGTIKYEWNYDSIRNLNIYPCISEDNPILIRPTQMTLEHGKY
jgi:hypothetical protein